MANWLVNAARALMETIIYFGLIAHIFTTCRELNFTALALRIKNILDQLRITKISHTLKLCSMTRRWLHTYMKKAHMMMRKWTLYLPYEISQPNQFSSSSTCVYYYPTAPSSSRRTIKINKTPYPSAKSFYNTRRNARSMKKVWDFHHYTHEYVICVVCVSSVCGCGAWHM